MRERETSGGLDWMGKVSPSGVGHSYNMCHRLAVLAYLVRVRVRGEREREL